MKILVTGATGFIGSHLCRRWQAKGHDLVGLSRSPEAARARVPELGEVFAWDALEQAVPREAFDGVDAIVHLAGESVAGRWTPKKKQLIRESRASGTRHLVEGLVVSGAQPRSLISASAIGFYGDRGDEPLTEGSAGGDDFLARVCKEWEKEAIGAHSSRTRVSIARLGIVLAKEGGAMKRMLTPFRLGLGGRLGSGRQWWSWIHIEDVCRAIDCLLDEGGGGVWNLTAPEPVRQVDFARSLASALSRPALLPAPSMALRIVLGEFSGELLSSKRVLPRRLLDTGFEHSFPRLEPSLLALLHAGARAGGPA